ncbi:MAG TPA: hydrogenase 2 operon protein HybA [Candidatus Paceibacterota bacterium]|nr:hydrogenase 2 operon protein HybA [Verrucomicrobiota bacterium]HRY49324.1 hydrogenase 2 operon protein HybA [Candidatus Paceibacterota bacterium]
MKKQNRRDFFKILGVTGAGLVTPAGSASASDAAVIPNQNELGMLYDATRCVGCKACMAACKRVNGDYGSLAYEPASFDSDALWDAPMDLSGDTRTIIKLGTDGPGKSFVKHSCMHCQKPSCVSVCPVSAMTKDKETGIVDYNKNTCIGCRYCQIACAFNIPKFQWDRALPQIVKCDLCRNTHLKTKGVPACAEICPTGAIQFGRRGALIEEARRRMQEEPGRYVPHIYGEHEVGGTNHLYLAAMPFEKLGLPTLPKDAPAAFSEKIQHTLYKGFIAPVVLYSLLGGLALMNLKKHHDHPASAPDAEDQQNGPHAT